MRLLIFIPLLTLACCCMIGVEPVKEAADCPWQLAGSGTSFPIHCSWSDDAQSYQVIMLTAGHVASILPEGPLLAYHRDGRVLAGGKVLGIHLTKDAALVQFLSPHEVATLKIDHRPLSYGERVLIPGYQGNSCWVVEGFISQPNQVSAPMFSGGSGSPVIDRAGHVRALVSAIAVYYASPVERVYVFHHCYILPLYEISEWLEEVCSASLLN